MSGTIQQRLKLQLPIIQAPMAGVQGSALAIAVSTAGGLGSLPCAILSPAGIGEELAAIAAACDRPVNVKSRSRPTRFAVTTKIRFMTA